MKYTFILVLVLFICPTIISAAETGFMGLAIGMTREQVIAAAEKNDLIAVPKNRDVEFFPVEQRKILTFSIKPEVPSIYLQFVDNVLYAITVIFDEKYMDYYTIVKRLEEKYGRHTVLTPQWREWRIGDVTVKAEKPAVVKYIALEKFLKAASFEKKAHKANDRRDTLLNGL
jgi:hypothetical protein